MSQTTLRTLSCLLRGSSNIEASIWVWLHLPRNSTENRPLPVGIAWLVRNARERATEDWENDPCALVCKKVSQAQWFFSRNILHSNVIWSHSGACLMKAWLGGFDILGSRRRSNKSRANSLVCLLFFCLLYKYISSYIFNIQSPPIDILLHHCLDVLNGNSFQPTGSFHGAEHRNNVACPALDLRRYRDDELAQQISQGKQERVHEQKTPQKSKVCSDRVLPKN